MDGWLGLIAHDPIHLHIFSQAFERVVVSAGLPVIRFHDLRHTHASPLLKAGVPVKVVSERLGHATPAFTMNVYQHVIPGMQAEAASAFSRLLHNEKPTESGSGRGRDEDEPPDPVGARLRTARTPIVEELQIGNRVRVIGLHRSADGHSYRPAGGRTAIAKKVVFSALAGSEVTIFNPSLDPDGSIALSLVTSPARGLSRK